jgi:hypothetical protein
MASSPTVHAGDDLTALLLGVPAWTPMTGSYTNVWSDTGAGNVTGQYRLWPLNNEVEIIGTISHGVITGNSAFFTLPGGFVPGTAQLVCQWSDTGNHIGALTVATSGVLTLNNLNATTIVQFHGWISLDA